jgi:hypothetical protein
LLALVVEGVEIGRLVTGLEGGIGPLLILPIAGDCIAELVTVGLDDITVRFEGRMIEALLVIGISIDVDEIAVAVLVVGPSVDIAISELATGLIVE